MRLGIVAISTSIALLAACGGPTSKPTVTSKKPGAETASIAPTAKIVFTYFNEDYARYVFEIANPARDLTRVGVKTRWKALDADGVIVDSYDKTQPPIPPGESILYVGGTGDPTGNPEQVSVAIVEKGRLVKTPARMPVSVVEAAFTRSDYDEYTGSDDYDVTATLEAIAPFGRDDVTVSFILRDAAGKIVGAEFADLETAPKEVAAGEKVRAETYVSVETGNTPEKVEAVATPE